MYDTVQGTKGNRGWGYKRRNVGHGGICSTYNSVVKMPNVNRIFNNVYTMNLKITS